MVRQGKIAIIGAGHVGSHCAMALALGGVGEQIVLIDKDELKAKAQAWDVSDSLSFLQPATKVSSGSYSDCTDANIVVIAIGEPRLPGQTRLDLLGNSIAMLSELLSRLKLLPIPGIVITITNPADIVADYVRRGLGLSRFRAFGTGTLLDTARLIRLLSEQTGYPRSEIDAVALGEHGDSSMIPFSQVRLGGKPFDGFPSLDRSEILKRTRWAGMEIIDGKGSTEFGIGQALSYLCDGILADRQRVLPLSVSLEGEYGQSGVHCGVPCRVGQMGIEAIVELDLTPQESYQLNESCDLIRRHIHVAYEQLNHRN